VPVISTMGGSRDSPTARTNTDDRTGRYPWVKVVEATGQAAGDAERVLGPSGRSASPVSTRKPSSIAVR